MSHLQIQRTSKSPWLYIAAILTLAISGLILITIMRPANAISTSGFKAGDIMSDAVMSNKGTMTESKIQSFLKSKNTCDEPVSGSGVTVYSSTRAYVKGTLNGQPATWWWNISGGANGHFLCMADDSFSGQSAAHVIYQAAQDYNINPQVLIVLLQKEQGLVTDQWPNDHQYAAATGYNCPDTPSGCNNANAGFITQVRDAASLFHDVLTGGWSNYPAYTTTYIQYNPDKSCSGSKVYIVNRATSSLYRYTPYQPNSATLAAGWPSPGVSCGAYGNLNFYMYFTQWFGSTHYVIQGSIGAYYSANNGPVTFGDPLGNEKTDGNGFHWQKFENGYIAGQGDTGYFGIVWSIGKYYDSHNGPSRLGKPLGLEQKDPNSNIRSQAFANGHIVGYGDLGYFSILGKIDTSYQKQGGISKYGQPLADQVSINPGAYSQQFQNGYIVGSDSTGYYESSGPIRDYWIGHGMETGRLGLPTSNISTIGDGVYQQYEGGTVVGSSTTGYYVVKGSIGKTYLDNITDRFANLGFPTDNEKSVNGINSQAFQSGYIAGGWGMYYGTTTDIYNYWIGHGAQNGPLGMPTNNSSSTNGVNYQYYSGGIVVDSAAGGYHAVRGSIYTTYASIGGVSSALGYPTEDEKSVGNYAQQNFENGIIVGDHGVYRVVLNGPIMDRWLQLGGLTGTNPLGAAIDSQREDSEGIVWQRFQYGYIVMRKGNSKAWESRGSIRNYWVSTGLQDGPLGMPIGPEVLGDDGSWTQEYEHGSIRTFHGVGSSQLN